MLCFCGVPAAGAATPDKKSDKVVAIREAYAAALKNVELSKVEGIPHNYMESSLRYVVPALGETFETLRCYYDQDVETEHWHVVYLPYFLTRKYNFSVRNIYEEYLFDSEGHLIFVFVKSDSMDGKEKVEERYYFDSDGTLIKELVKGIALNGADVVQRYGQTLYNSIRTQLEANATR